MHRVNGIDFKRFLLSEAGDEEAPRVEARREARSVSDVVRGGSFFIETAKRGEALLETGARLAGRRVPRRAGPPVWTRTGRAVCLDLPPSASGTL